MKSISSRILCSIGLTLSALLAHSGTCASQPLAPATTRQQTVRPVALTNGTPWIVPCAVSNYAVYGYSSWQFGPGVDAGQRFDLMPPNYAGVTNAARLLTFFTLTDIHITDEETPNQAIAVGYLGGNSSAYSPVILYTPHVLDAAIKTINALHRQLPFDFGIALGDLANSPQYNELRWFIDILDGKRITPSSGTNAGADTIDYQRPFQAAGLAPSIPWYVTLGNHDHLWLGSYPVTEYFRQCYTNQEILLLGDLFTEGPDIRSTYMGSIDGRTPYGDIIGVGSVTNFITPEGITNAPKVLAADPNRYPLTRTNWMKEFFNTACTSKPPGHGFAETNIVHDFACYSFEPKAGLPLKVIVLDDTQAEQDFEMHGQGALDTNRLSWLVSELDKGQQEDKLMIIAAHVPIEAIGYGFKIPPAIRSTTLLPILHSYPNLILWISGHVHRNKVTPQPWPDRPECGFWEVETASLRDFPQQFRTFEILRNTDNTISILATDVDPVVEKGAPAEISRGYAIGAARIFKSNTTSLDDTNSYAYNAELIKPLSTAMQTKIAGLGGSLGHRISVDQVGSSYVLTFLGKLQSADAMSGPWADVAGATNQYVAPTEGAMKFYRAVE